MLELVIFIAIALFIALPIGAFINAANAAHKAEECRKKIDDLQCTVALLQQQPPAPPCSQPALVDPYAKPEPPPVPRVIPPSTPAAEPVMVPHLPPPSRPTAPPPLPPMPRRTPPPSVEPPAKAAFDMERFMGIKLFAWAGGLLLFISVALFLKYAIEQNLFPPAVRVAGGFAIGIGLLIAGTRLHRIAKYQVLAHTLCATGTVVSYGVSFAAHALYHLPLFSVSFTFGIMVCITAVAFLLSARMDARVIAVLGMLGGFLTPYLINSGQDRPLALFTYIATLNAGLIALTLRKRWDFLVILGAVGTVIYEFGWSTRWLHTHRFFDGIPWGPYLVHIGFPLLFLIAPIFLRSKIGSSVAPGLAVLITSAAAILWSFNEQASLPFDQYLAIGYTFLFAINFIIMTVAALQPRLIPGVTIANALTFLHLAIWTHQSLAPDRVFSALALYSIAAALPVGLIFLRKKLLTQLPTQDHLPVWPALIAQASLCGLTLHWAELPPSVWISVLFFSAMITALCIWQKQLLGILASSVMSLLALAIWVHHSHPSPLAILGLLLLFTLVHALGAALAWSRSSAPAPTDSTDVDERAIPVSTVWMPFGLLAYAVTQIKFNQPSPLFLTLLFLILAMLWLAEWLALPLIAPVAAGSAMGVIALWHNMNFDIQQPWTPLLWYAGVHAVFSFNPWKLKRATAVGIHPWATGATVGIPLFAIAYTATKSAFPALPPGLIPAFFAIPALTGLHFAAQHSELKHQKNILAWYAGAALFFITFIFPTQFEHETLTLGWALEGAALCWLVRRIDHPPLAQLGLALLSVVFVRLTLNFDLLHYHTRSGTPILNWFLYTYLTAAAAFAFAAWKLPEEHSRLGALHVTPLLWGCVGILLFTLLNIEIADAFTAEGSTYVAIEFGGNFARSMTYSIAWGLFALGLIILGLWKRQAGARYAGIGLLAITLLKLFFHDLSSIGQLYRIAAFFVVAVIALTASWLYQRFSQGESK